MSIAIWENKFDAPTGPFVDRYFWLKKGGDEEGNKPQVVLAAFARVRDGGIKVYWDSPAHRFEDEEIQGAVRMEEYGVCHKVRFGKELPG